MNEDVFTSYLYCRIKEIVAGVVDGTKTSKDHGEIRVLGEIKALGETRDHGATKAGDSKVKAGDNRVTGVVRSVLHISLVCNYKRSQLRDAYFIYAELMHAKRYLFCL